MPKQSGSGRRTGLDKGLAADQNQRHHERRKTPCATGWTGVRGVSLCRPCVACLTLHAEMCSVLYMTTTEIKTVTIQDLHENPSTPVPYWVGGKPGMTEVLGDEVHVRRLVEWATIRAFSQHTRVEITGYISTNPKGYGPYSPLMGEIGAKLPTPRMHRDAFELDGWNLQITPPGLEPRDVRMWFEGYVVDEGTKADQWSAWERHAAKVAEGVRQMRAAEGHGRLDEVSRTTLEREDAQKATDSTDTAWRAAIKAAMVGGESATEVARLARISRVRVYQIKDDRR